MTGRAVTEIEAGQEGSVAFWEQGAASMYTNEAIVKRAEARHDPGVLDILHTWWETARRSLLLGVGSPMEKRGSQPRESDEPELLLASTRSVSRGIANRS